MSLTDFLIRVFMPQRAATEDRLLPKIKAIDLEFFLPPTRNALPAVASPSHFGEEETPPPAPEKSDRGQTAIVAAVGLLVTIASVLNAGLGCEHPRRSTACAESWEQGMARMSAEWRAYYRRN